MFYGGDSEGSGGGGMGSFNTPRYAGIFADWKDTDQDSDQGSMHYSMRQVYTDYMELHI